MGGKPTMWWIANKNSKELVRLIFAHNCANDPIFLPRSIADDPTLVLMTPFNTSDLIWCKLLINDKERRECRFGDPLHLQTLNTIYSTQTSDIVTHGIIGHVVLPGILFSPIFYNIMKHSQVFQQVVNTDFCTNKITSHSLIIIMIKDMRSWELRLFLQLGLFINK